MTTQNDQVSDEIKAVAADFATKIDAAVEAKEITEDQKGRLLLALEGVAPEDIIARFDELFAAAKDETKVAAEKAEAEAAALAAEEAKSNKIFKLELPAAARPSFRAARKLESVAIESKDKIMTVSYRAEDRDVVLESAKEFLVNGDASIHEVVGEGHSLYGVLESAGFEADNIAAMATIFEAAVNERVSAMEASFDVKVSEKAALAVEAMQDDFDAYVAKGVAEWVKENTLAIEHAVRLQNAESFIATISKAFEDIGLAIPEDKKDTVGQLESKVAELTSALEEAQATASELSTKVLAAEVAGKIDAAVEKHSISDAGKDRLFVMLEDFGLERFNKSFDLIVESFFSDKAPKAAAPAKVEATGDVVKESIIDGPKAETKAETVPFNPYAKHLRVMKIR